jgi:hypothetical protein
MIEMNLPMSVIDRDLIETRMEAQWKREQRKHKIAFTDDDEHFVYNAMANYWDMRLHVPFVILAQEPQVYNLRAGYGGSTDVILWFLGDWKRGPDGLVFEPLPDAEKLAVTWQKRANAGRVTVDDINEVGGQLAVGDWKTSASVYTEHVIQTLAYMGADFIALDGIIDERLTDILLAAELGMVIHIRPDGWAVDLFEFREDIAKAFLGSVAYARFLALHPTPANLFLYSVAGRADDTEKSEVIDDED